MYFTKYSKDLCKAMIWVGLLGSFCNGFGYTDRVSRGKYRGKQNAVARKLLQLAFLLPKWLPRKDSNLERENQNLLCYHYTTG